MRFPNRRNALVTLAGTMSLATPIARAQASILPKNIRLVVPFPPGNSSDIQARAFGEALRKSLGITVVVDNRPGGSGAIALQHVAAAKPDGSTLLVSSLSPLVVAPAINKALPYDTERDFVPIALLGFNEVVMVAGPATKVASFPDLIAYARRNPDELTYASIGTGTLGHLVMELIAARANVKMRHVPYKGSTQAYTDLIGGQVSVMIDGMPQALVQIKAGRFKPLAIISNGRSPFLDQVPTLAEANVQSLKDFEVVGWTGLLAPAGTPKDMISAINAETTRIFATTEMRDTLSAQSLRAFPAHNAESFGAFIHSELGKWRAMAKAAGVEGSK